MVVGDERALYADAAYASPRTRELIARTGLQNQVQSRGAANKKLTEADIDRNKEIGVTRGRIEAIFGHWKRHWGLRRTRFMGEAKMRIQTGLAAIGWNLWKGAGFKTRYG